MRSKLIVGCFMLIGPLSKAQLTDGSISPDFTLADINGNVQNLYSYLDAGKTVYLDIFAAHCPTCWAYHNTHALRDLYNNHGPLGSISQDIMVIAVEHDPGNGLNELTGVSGATAGDWVTGTPYPIINPEGDDRAYFNVAFDAVWYPMIYAICPNKIITLIGTQTESVLYDHVDACATIGITEETNENIHVFYNPLNRTLTVNGIVDAEMKCNLLDLGGRIVFTINTPANTLELPLLNQGVYIYTITVKGKQINGKLFIR